jgi:hypothetical protein
MPGKVPNSRQPYEAAHKRETARTTVRRAAAPTRQVDVAALQHGIADPRRARPADILVLQRTVGNRATTRLLQAGPLSTPTTPLIQRQLPGSLGIESDEEPLPRANTAAQVAGNIPTLDVQYERLARLAYPEGPGDARVLLRQWGYQPSWRRTVKGTAFFCGLLMPDPQLRPDQRPLAPHPVLIFQGSVELAHWYHADLDPMGVGYHVFQEHEDEVASLLQAAGGKVVVTGHSLGGTLAQWTTMAFPYRIQKLITFQAPGINPFTEYSRRGLKKPEQGGPEVVHHILKGDLLALAGLRRVSGQFYVHTLPGGEHPDPLLETSAFQRQLDELGLKVGTDKVAVDIKRYTSDPNKVKRAFVEFGRVGLSVIATLLVEPFVALYKLFVKPFRKREEQLFSTGRAFRKPPLSEKFYESSKLAFEIFRRPRKLKGIDEALKGYERVLKNYEVDTAKRYKSPVERAAELLTEANRLDTVSTKIEEWRSYKNLQIRERGPNDRKVRNLEERDRGVDMLEVEVVDGDLRQIGKDVSALPPEILQNLPPEDVQKLRVILPPPPRQPDRIYNFDPRRQAFDSNDEEEIAARRNAISLRPEELQSFAQLAAQPQDAPEKKK